MIRFMLREMYGAVSYMKLCIKLIFNTRRVYVLVISLFIFIVNLQANVIELSQMSQSGYIKNCDVAFDYSARITIDQILSGETELVFSPNKSKDVNWGFGDETVWIRITFRDNVPDVNDWALKINFPNLDNVNFYLTKDEHIVENDVGGTLNDTNNSGISSIPVFPFNTVDNGIYTVYLRIQTTSIRIIPVTIIPNKIKINSHNIYIFDFILFGILLGFVLYNLSLVLLVRERAYLFLSLYLLMMLIHFICLFGYTNIFSAYLSATDRIRIRFYSINSVFVFISLYYIDFLKLKTISVTLYYIFVVLIILSLSNIIAILAGVNLTFINSSGLIFYPFFAIYICATSFFLHKKGQIQALYLFIAFSIFIFSSLLYILMLYRVFSYNSIIFRISFITSGLHALFLTFGLSYEVNSAKQIKERSILISRQNKRLRIQIRKRRNLERRLLMINSNQERIIEERSAKIMSQILRFQTLVENLYEWVWQVDLQGKYLYNSPYSQTISGYNETELSSVFLFSTFAQSGKKDIIGMLDKSVKSNDKFQIDNIHLIKKNGKSIPVEISASPLSNHNGVMVGFIGITRDISERLAVEKKILDAIFKTENEERKRISIELHDGLNPVLSGIKLYLSSLFSPKMDKTRYKEIVIQLNEHIDYVMLEVKQIANNLLPADLKKLGLIQSLTRFVERMKDYTKIKVTLTIYNLTIDLVTEEKQLVIYRIISELLSNSIKHSKAENIDIEISMKKKVNIHFRDNGVGFNYEESLNSSKGIGLKSIFSRLKMVDGTLKCTSSMGNGVEYKIQI